MAHKRRADDPISNIETAILGLLEEGPCYGYELEKIIEVRGMRYWTEVGFSSIYYVLKRLEKKGLVQSGVKAGEAGKPARKIYSMTPKGKETMREKVKRLLSSWSRVPSPFDLGVMFSGLLAENEMKECIESYVDSLDKRLAFSDERIRHWKKSDSPVAPLAVIRFERQTALVRAEKNWVRGFLRKGAVEA